MSKEAIIKYLERRIMGEDYMDSRRGRTRMRDSRGRDVSYMIKGTSRHPDEEDYRRGREDSRRGRDYREEYEDYEDMRMDSRDYAEDYHNYKHVKLTKADINRWKQMMHNVDGTHGEHFDMQQVMLAAEKLGIRFDSYDEKEFCLAVNMMYSDYGHVLRKYCPPDKELMACAEMAKAFFDDPDGPEPSEKLALYFYCIADNG